ncbi:MAG TPA: MBL fold metallo-hydrolase [Steroidobacteraceae bacterium]|jgi:beta-lactamase superfamily II metal-dependent hydrolase
MPLLLLFSGLSALFVAEAALARDDATGGNSKQLEIYFIDVEGGQSTLVVTPDRRALLIDTGFAGDGGMSSRAGDPKVARDANRIVAAARDAGVKRIDDLLITHFHPDHDGGAVELSQLLPIDTFIDHSSISPLAAANPDYKSAYEAYVAMRGSRAHIDPKPGDLIPFKDIEVTVVSSAGATILKALPGAGEINQSCQAAPTPAADPNENPRSTGVVIRYGKFRFLDVGDLSGGPLFDLVCPRSKIGRVDVYLVAHHGGPDVGDPAILEALKPSVAIVNNGPRKGGAVGTLRALHGTSASIWQLHRSEAAGESNFSDDRIANLDENTSYWIKLIARPDGTFRIVNQRTGVSEEHPSKK